MGDEMSGTARDCASYGYDLLIGSDGCYHARARYPSHLRLALIGLLAHES